MIRGLDDIYNEMMSRYLNFYSDEALVLRAKKKLLTGKEEASVKTSKRKLPTQKGLILYCNYGDTTDTSIFRLYCPILYIEEDRVHTGNDSKLTISRDVYYDDLLFEVSHLLDDSKLLGSFGALNIYIGEVREFNESIIGVVDGEIVFIFGFYSYHGRYRIAKVDLLDDKLIFKIAHRKLYFSVSVEDYSFIESFKK